MRRLINTGTIAGVSCCVVGALATAQDVSNREDSASASPSRTPVVQPPQGSARATAGGNAGGIAGLSPIVFDNGPLVTGEAAACTPAGTRSSLQNTTLCHDTLGSNATNEGTTVFWIADDFALTQTTDLQTIEFFLYETSPTTVPSITTMNVQLHSAQPANPTSSVIQSATGGVASATTTYRAALNATTALCTRRIQMVSVDVSAWPNLAPGTYWLSWQATGSAVAGPWQPPVTILGLHGKPGANGMQAQGAAGVFNPILEDGPTPPAVCPGGSTLPPPTAQDSVFVVRGDVIGGPSCPGDSDGDSDVDADDLTNVILQWGNTCPCGADVDDDNDVDSDDLTVVILEWGTPC